MHTQFSTISTSDLVRVAGGGGPPKPRANDAAGQYGATLKKDWNDVQARAGQTANDLRNHQWGNAALHFGGTMVNEIKLASDAAKPIKDLIGLGK
jgi:hypothetical protein